MAIVSQNSVWTALSERRPTLTVEQCPICGDSLKIVDERGHCPVCGSRPRTRSLAPILEKVVNPLLTPSLVAEKPLLAFALAPLEKKLLATVFKSFRSASLYGQYGENHEVGVDVRDLSRYADASFSGVFASLLFDYFEEHEKALAECFRVIAPGGSLFTLIATNRLLDGDQPPRLRGLKRPAEKGWVSHIPSEGVPTMAVGRSWFLKAMKRAGFESMDLSVTDRPSGQLLSWLVGVKSAASSGREPASESWASVAREASIPPVGKVDPSPAGPAILGTNEWTTAFDKTCSTPVDPAFGFKRVTVELSVPSVPSVAAKSAFSEHVYDHGARRATDLVIASQKDGIVVSEDLGRTWDYVPVPRSTRTSLRNSFTLADGTHLMQGQRSRRGGEATILDAPILRFDRVWQPIDIATTGLNQWHGTHSIDEANGTIIYGEYPANFAKFRFEKNETARRGYVDQGLVTSSSLFRSRDQGKSWEAVLTCSPEEIRHFHTVIADPHQAGRWWASSGDLPRECEVWCSEDDGTSWTKMTNSAVEVPLHPKFEFRRQSVHRCTAMIATQDELIWGVDDWLGSPKDYGDGEVAYGRRVGARLCVSPKTRPLQPRVIGFCGNPVRSIIDVGEAYVITTQATDRSVGLRPEVFLCSKKEPFRVQSLFTVDNFGESTKFTASRASKAAKDGVFFSLRASTDAFAGGARILRWRIAFD